MIGVPAGAHLLADALVISTWTSTAMPTVSTIPAIPRKLSVA